MQKVVYSVSKVNRDEKFTGVGYLAEGNLLIPATSQKGKSYILSSEFDYDEFYKIAPHKDIFYCAATKKCYLPLTSSGEKGQLIEYIINPERLRPC